MNNKIRVYVGWRDIDCGVISSCSSCPIALALKRKFKRSIIMVTYHTKYIVNIGKHVYTMCNKAQEFATLFDIEGKHAVYPFHAILTKIR